MLAVTNACAMCCTYRHCAERKFHSNAVRAVHTANALCMLVGDSANCLLSALLPKAVPSAPHSAKDRLGCSIPGVAPAPASMSCKPYSNPNQWPLLQLALAAVAAAVIVDIEYTDAMQLSKIKTLLSQADKRRQCLECDCTQSST